MADLPAGFWDDLLDYIQEGMVIPVLGSELVTVREGERDVPLDGWLAGRLMADLGLPEDELPAGFHLNDVVSLHLRKHRKREELYPRINRILRREAPAPSTSLQALAGIPRFDLFVSLTFDSLLAESVGAARLGGGGSAEQIVYSPNVVRDLPRPKADLGHPVVFHLLGRASTSPDYAICDDDLLEFLHALQDKQRQPKLLFDELRSHHLLILGCHYGDWLARFFLRTARNLELAQRRQRQEMLIGDHLRADDGLVLFLESYSSDTQVVTLTAADFVAELARRWHAAHPPGALVVVPPPDAGKSVPDGAVFVSYASEDVEAARRLVEGLLAVGLEVWFDRSVLEPGDAWKRRIRQGLAGCSLFLPVISSQALGEEKRRRFFWWEWRQADERAQGMAPDEVFLVPVVIDGTSFRHPALPDSFPQAQGVALPEGKPTPEFAHRIAELVRAFHRRRRAA